MQLTSLLLTRADGTIIPLRNFNKKDLHPPMLELFNLFNRANFTDWVVNEQSARFGEPESPTRIAYQPRVVQLGFRAPF